jgi:hypothetical protein
MTRFRDALQHAHARLQLPQPTKSRILLEMAADLEDAYASFRAEGATEEEAIGRAVERFSVSDEALARLTELHASACRRFLDRLSARGQARSERAGLVLLLIFVALVGGRSLRAGEIVPDAGWLLWPLVGAWLAALAVALQRVYVLFIKKDHDVRRVRRGLSALLGLAGLHVLWAVWGSLLELQRAALAVTGDAARIGPRVVGWLIESSALMVLGLTGAILIALVWFALHRKASAVEQAEVAYLLAE